LKRLDGGDNDFYQGKVYFLFLEDKVDIKVGGIDGNQELIIGR